MPYGIYKQLDHDGRTIKRTWLYALRHQLKLKRADMARMMFLNDQQYAELENTGNCSKTKFPKELTLEDAVIISQTFGISMMQMAEWEVPRFDKRKYKP